MALWLALAAIIVPSVVSTAAVVTAALISARQNRDAHAAISKNIAGVEERVERRADAFERRMDAQQTVLQSMAREISFLAGRQAEPDNQR